MSITTIMAHDAARLYAVANTKKHTGGGLAEQAIYLTNVDNKITHFTNGYNAAILAGYDLANLFNSHIDWAAETFPKQTSVGAMRHLIREAKEVIADIEAAAPRANKIEEYANCFGCLLSSMAQEGITIAEFADAFGGKLEINKGREWIDNGDGSYSHIKSDDDCYTAPKYFVLILIAVFIAIFFVGIILFQQH